MLIQALKVRCSDGTHLVNTLQIWDYLSLPRGCLRLACSRTHHLVLDVFVRTLYMILIERLSGPTTKARVMVNWRGSPWPATTYKANPASVVPHCAPESPEVYPGLSNRVCCRNTAQQSFHRSVRDTRPRLVSHPNPECLRSSWSTFSRGQTAQDQNAHWTVIERRNL